MYPRLVLARELLREDGVIFISIDDNEVHHLRQIMNEVFGEELVETFVWRKSGIGRDGKMKNTTTFRNDHEYIFVGYKDAKELNKSFEKPNFENEYGNPDNDPRGNYKIGSISLKEEASNPNHKRYYTVISPTGKSVTRQFDVELKEFNRLNEDKRIYWGKDGNAVPQIKIFTNEERNVTTSSLIDYKDMTTTLGGKQLEEILQLEGIGNEIRPKPIALIKKLIQISTAPNDLILDFFAGSGTTGQAVMELNQEELDKQTKDGMFEDKTSIVGGRKFILVQLPEKIDEKKEAFKAGYKNISDITIERVKRAGEKYKGVDNGFKVLSVTESAINRKFMNTINASKEEIFAEIALQFGYGLNFVVKNLFDSVWKLTGNERSAIVILGSSQLTNEMQKQIIGKSDELAECQIFAQDACLNVEIIHNLYQHFEQKRVVIL